MSIIFQRDAGVFLRAVYKEAPGKIDFCEPPEGRENLAYFTPANRHGDRIAFRIRTAIDPQFVGKLYHAVLEDPVGLLSKSVIQTYLVIITYDPGIPGTNCPQARFYPTDSTRATPFLPQEALEKYEELRGLNDIVAQDGEEWERREHIINAMVDAWASALEKEQQPIDVPVSVKT